MKPTTYEHMGKLFKLTPITQDGLPSYVGEYGQWQSICIGTHDEAGRESAIITLKARYTLHMALPR